VPKVFTSILFAGAGAGLLWLASCSPEDLFPDDPNVGGKDTATTFTLKYTNLSTSAVAFASCFDPDGAGPEAPSLLNTIRMKPNTEYDLELEVQDDTDPRKSINLTDTILRFPKNYRVCMASPVNLNYVPRDSDGTWPIGLQYRMKTGAAMNTTMKVTLRNQRGVKNGACEPGTLMLEVNFPLSVQ
jgi:hypothetical protein